MGKHCVSFERGGDEQQFFVMRADGGELRR